jgi:branched-chain amino acid transport system substrate-binding protein
MRQSLFALATAAFLLAACGGSPKTSTTTAPSTTTTTAGSPVTASGKTRIALLLPLSGQSAPIGQYLQQAAEMALFDTGAKELALAAYDSGETADTSNDEQAAQRGVWIMGIAAPPQVRRVVDHAVDAGIKRFAAFAPQTSYGQQMVQTMESQVTIRGGKVAAVELFDANSADLNTPARRLAEASRGEDKLAVLVPVAPPRLSAALAALAAAGIDNKSVQLIGTGVWDVPNIGSEIMLRGAWYAAPDPAKRADFERRFLSTYGRPPPRLATLAYDGVSLAGHLARLKQGGDFSAEAITNPNGWSGIDGIFRFLPNGRSERALAVIAVQSGPGSVVSPAPTSFTKPVN